ncbi:DUF262 domain-containing HNH endonuclease family protein [Spiroplasma endosymbiont of Crioceris asparagi]|uniref:DUF262 domain-containing protein n=1 Tax=Spiroplasma endosymbiont of Crioceris asparagi TaxID=3066286 RepID=UPI0030D02B33
MHMNKNWKEINEFLMTINGNEYLEELLKENNLDKTNHISVEARRLMEYLFKYILDSKGFRIEKNDPTLIKLINDLKQYYFDENNGIAWPKDVDFSIHHIRLVGNSYLHPDDFGALRIKKNDFNSNLQILKYIHFLIQFLIKNFFNSNFQIKEFDDEIYYENFNKTRHIFDVKKNEIKIENDSLKLKKLTISELILNENFLFFIPSYQRKYKWNETNCEELIKNIIAKYKTDDRQEYFGPMAITLETDNSDKKNVTLRMIDGQQRITTSIILFKVLYEIMLEKKCKNIPFDLSNIFKSKDLLEIKYKNATEDEIERQAIEIIINNNLSFGYKSYDLIRYASENSNAAKNYLFFYNYLNKKDFSEEDIIEIYEYFANQYVVSCIDFKKEPNEEMEIFENLNSKGTELTAFDMFKNFLFNIINKQDFIKNENKIVSKFKEYLSFEKMSQSINRKPQIKIIDDMEEEFLFYFCLYKSKNGDLKKDKKSILRVIKNDIFNKKENISFEEYKNLIEEIGKYAYIYFSFKIKAYKNDKNNFLYHFAKNLNNLEHKEVTQLFLFFLVDVYGKNKWFALKKQFSFTKTDYFKKCLFQLEKWYVSLIQVYGTGQSLTKPLIKLINFLSFYDFQNSSYLETLPKIIERWFNCEGKDSITIVDEAQNNYFQDSYSNLKTPSEEQFENSIKNGEIKDQNIALILLRRIEEKELEVNEQIYREKNSLEHIMPQKLNQKWLEELREFYPNKNDSWILDKHKEMNNYLGNYAFLDKNDNSKLKNREFSFKLKQIYSKSKCPLFTMDFVIPQNDEIKNILKLEKFDFEIIKARNSKMARIAANIYYE